MAIYKNVHQTALVIGRKRLLIGETIDFDSLTSFEKDEALLWVSKGFLKSCDTETKAATSEPIEPVVTTTTADTSSEEVTEDQTKVETEQQFERRRGRKVQ